MNEKFQIKTFIKISAYFIGLAAVFAAVAVTFSTASSQDKEQSALIADSLAVQKQSFPLIVIDPGHGGMDGGAVSDSGVCEKNINLSIAKDLCALFGSFGIECVMTREDDVMLSDAEGSTRKMQDLRARVRMTEDRDCVFISIHQNKFPSASCRGTQVYYSKNDPRSQKLADIIQTTVRSYVQPDNGRAVKAAGSEIFVLDQCRVPAVLIECGFLSNPSELALLQTEEYQKKTACAVFCAVMDYLEVKTDTNEK